MPEQNHQGRTVLVEKINAQLSAFTAAVTSGVKNNLSTRNVLAETTVAGLLNRIFSWKLVNANGIRSNFPAVDLVDMEAKVAVQVTSTNTVRKIDLTLEKFTEHNLSADFDRLYVVIITADSATDSMHDRKLHGIFCGKDDIWNIPALLGKIKELETPVLEDILDYLEREVGKVAGLKPYLYARPRNTLGDGFVGREMELGSIRMQLNQGIKPVVLSGLGGMGKTELASRFGNLYTEGNVYMIRFQTSFTATITAMYANIHPAPTQQPDEEAQLKAVMELLSQCGEKDLLIIDNVDADSGSLADLMRDPVYQKLLNLRPRILITTRFDRDRAIPVGPLPNSDLHQIFRAHDADLTQPQMDALIQAVNKHTMTIDLMARTLNGKGWKKVTAEDMLRAIRENTLPAEKYRKIATDYNQSEEQARIYQHLSVVFDASGVPESGKNVLRCAALLPETGMDGSIFGESLPEDQQEALDELLEHGWLSMEKDLLHIHPVVRMVCIAELQPTDESCERFLYSVANHVHLHKNNPVYICQFAKLYSHASDILKDKEADFTLLAASNWFHFGDAENALKYYTRVIKRSESEVLPLGNVLAAYNNAGSACDKLGNYKEAIDHHLIALAVSEKIYPNGSAKNALYWNNIGASYAQMGDHKNALKYKLGALEVLKKEKPGSIELAICLDNIGMTYGDIGKTDQALPYHLQALEIFEKEENIELAIALDNIGHIYDTKKEYSTALKFKLRALRIFKRFYSGKNIDLALVYGNVCSTCAALGDYESALNYIEKAIRAVPDGHPKLRNYSILREELLKLVNMKHLGIRFPNPFAH